MTDTLIDLIRTGTHVHARTSLDDIFSLRDRRRQRRRSGMLAGTAAAGIGATIAVASTGNGASTAWAVEKTSPETVTVTITQLRDAAGLQRARHAQGVPATVNYGAHPCTYAPAAVSKGLKAFTQSSAPDALDVVQIHPAGPRARHHPDDLRRWYRNQGGRRAQFPHPGRLGSQPDLPPRGGDGSSKGLGAGRDEALIPPAVQGLLSHVAPGPGRIVADPFRLEASVAGVTSGSSPRRSIDTDRESLLQARGNRRSEPALGGAL